MTIACPELDVCQTLCLGADGTPLCAKYEVGQATTQWLSNHIDHIKGCRAGSEEIGDINAVSDYLLEVVETQGKRLELMVKKSQKRSDWICCMWGRQRDYAILHFGTLDSKDRKQNAKKLERYPWDDVKLYTTKARQNRVQSTKPGVSKDDNIWTPDDFTTALQTLQVRARGGSELATNRKRHGIDLSTTDGARRSHIAGPGSGPSPRKRRRSASPTREHRTQTPSVEPMQEFVPALTVDDVCTMLSRICSLHPTHPRLLTPKTLDVDERGTTLDWLLIVDEEHYLLAEIDYAARTATLHDPRGSCESIAGVQQVNEHLQRHRSSSAFLFEISRSSPLLHKETDVAVLIIALYKCAGQQIPPTMNVFFWLCLVSRMLGRCDERPIVEHVLKHLDPIVDISSWDQQIPVSTLCRQAEAVRVETERKNVSMLSAANELFFQLEKADQPTHHAWVAVGKSFNQALLGRVQAKVDISKV